MTFIDFFSEVLVDNYKSSNKLQFPPHQGSDGKDPLPTQRPHAKKSGFVRDVPQTLPPYKQTRTGMTLFNY